jgi:DNA-binding MarR family transcriptional regulator
MGAVLRALSNESFGVASGDYLKPLYIETLSLVERLHRRLPDVIKAEFDRAAPGDINSVQALLLFNIGESEVPASELRARGYYLGSNVSYSLRKLADMGYISQRRSPRDARSVYVSLTEKGRNIAGVVDRLYERHIERIGDISGIGPDDFQSMHRSLKRLDRFLTDQILYRL